MINYNFAKTSSCNETIPKCQLLSIMIKSLGGSTVFSMYVSLCYWFSWHSLQYDSQFWSLCQIGTLSFCYYGIQIDLPVIFVVQSYYTSYLYSLYNCIDLFSSQCLVAYRPAETILCHVSQFPRSRYFRLVWIYIIWAGFYTKKYVVCFFYLKTPTTLSPVISCTSLHLRCNTTVFINYSRLGQLIKDMFNVMWDCFILLCVILTFAKTFAYGYTLW